MFHEEGNASPLIDLNYTHDTFWHVTLNASSVQAMFCIGDQSKCIMMVLAAATFAGVGLGETEKLHTLLGWGQATQAFDPMYKI